MKNIRRFLSAAVTVIFLSVTATADDVKPSSKLTVEATYLQNTRGRALIKQWPRSSYPEKSLRIMFRVYGESVENVTHAGKLKLTKAVDNAGRNLIHKKFNIRQTTTLYPVAVRDVPFNSPNAKRAFGFTISVASPNSPAKSVTVSGHIAVVTTAYSKILLPLSKLKGMAGNVIEKDESKKLGVQIKITREGIVSQNNPKLASRYAYFEFTGVNRTKLKKVWLVGNNGKILAQNPARHIGKKSTCAISVRLSQLTKDEKLQFLIAGETKEMVIPFEFKSLPLP
jgi:hypothetical protein